MEKDRKCTGKELKICNRVRWQFFIGTQNPQGTTRSDLTISSQLHVNEPLNDLPKHFYQYKEVHERGIICMKLLYILKVIDKKEFELTQFFEFKYILLRRNHQKKRDPAIFFKYTFNKRSNVVGGCYLRISQGFKLF